MLLEERARLQAELAATKAENEANLKALRGLLSKDFKFELTMEQVYAQVDKETSLAELVAELEAEAEKP